VGDRYYINNMKCAYCGVIQEEVYYAPSCGFTTHLCYDCGEENKIYLGFKLIKKEKQFEKEEGEK